MDRGRWNIDIMGRGTTVGFAQLILSLLLVISVFHCDDAVVSRSTMTIRQPLPQSVVFNHSFNGGVLFGMRGGADLVVEDEEEALSEEGEEEEDVTEEEEETDEEEEEEEEETDSEENEAEEEEEEDTSTSNTVLPPVKVHIRTNLHSALIDQTLEFTASRKRDVASLKHSIFRQMRGRPPMASQTLRLGTRVLKDDEIVADLVEEDEHDDDEVGDDDEKEATLTLLLDMPPPVDPKFATDLGSQLGKMTVNEVLDAYVINMAVLHRNAMDMLDTSIMDEEDDMEDSLEKNIPSSVTMRKHALLVKEQLLNTFPEDVLKLLQQNQDDDDEAEDGDSINIDRSGEQDMLLKESIKSKGAVRKKSAMKGGAKMTVKRALQRNLNINWPDTIRNTLLFAVIGHFGGRSQASRHLLLAMAPLCFILQLRFIKIYLKQLFYMIGKPPGILLSLLPAPQQAIMAFDMAKSMRAIYGNTISTDVVDSGEDKDYNEEEEEDYDVEEEEEDYDE